jgi:hypothetical protein
MLAPLLAVCISGCGGSRPAAGGRTVALFNRAIYDYSASVPISQEARRYSVMVLQATDSGLVAALHAANPQLRILVYQDLLISKPSDPAGLTTCTSYAAVAADHPGWFLKDRTGSPAINRAYSGDYLMDVGNPAYQRACAQHAAALAARSGFDGVFFDDLTARLSFDLDVGTTVPEYPDSGAWQAAMYSMIAYAGPQLRAHGRLAIGNIGGAVSTPGLWQQWNGPLDGAEEESWDGGSGSTAQQIQDWPARLGELVWSEAHGKYIMLHSDQTDEAGVTYGLASMLLAAGGHASYSAAGPSGAREPWFSEYDAARQLGAPVGAYKQLSNGVFERWFAHGLVLVNPTANAVRRFPLGGGTYSGSGLGRVVSVAMDPASGLILRTVS